ncbi:MAG: peptide deformylase [Lentisphaerae bacterium]|jgi:peptide deformylase|nr:peptide deformylase [Lentisphaerota bacterium]MBT4821460.1 peptide deformylase [Lentisphaerota bacterium]MBT5610153.1 peptide deformylase [Lentisphaerota bacterium]MBT7056957.1 peptide deformylase [Lentisphaerota bacterium]MBT7848291.1 peptide deformylase [Lentisphaerota bacterium]
MALELGNEQERPQPLRVRTYGDPVLRRKAPPVDEITQAVRDLAARMIVTMYENEIRGVGLAAPQVGVSLRLITLATHDPDEPIPPNASPGERMLSPRMPIALINPEIVKASSAMEEAVEGCLSIPEVQGGVCRPASVVVKALTLGGQTIQAECGGLLGRCLQHEIDHLDGILFVDRWREVDSMAHGTQLRAIEKKAIRSASGGRRS